MLSLQAKASKSSKSSQFNAVAEAGIVVMSTDTRIKADTIDNLLG